MKKLRTFAAAYLNNLLSFSGSSRFERKNFVWSLLSVRIEAAFAYVQCMYNFCYMAFSSLLQKSLDAPVFSGEYVLNNQNFNLFQVNK